MKLKILISLFSLIATILTTLVCWWSFDCPELHSNDAFLLIMVENDYNGSLYYEKYPIESAASTIVSLQKLWQNNDNL